MFRFGGNKGKLRPELYLCTPVKVNTIDTYYIVGFEPNATMDTAHHIILYGCSKPGSSKPLWNCGEMSDSSDTSMTIASPCEDDSEYDKSCPTYEGYRVRVDKGEREGSIDLEVIRVKKMFNCVAVEYILQVVDIEAKQQESQDRTLWKDEVNPCMMRGTMLDDLKR
ncbi:hypothetical protein TSAR_006430 [Trichomalopsis sarcophagae]|uniref:Copper type II ascorbate-dependent monooxygenase N-terminal domain-containing protein n=1 Tax=Trichomalopsis sarcophagae TaxID=543379 RepID=A0A232EP10_9HYME|nr:hypothetical protein TSAR_006430 [Trichomalopsis sarcophagae]